MHVNTLHACLAFASVRLKNTKVILLFSRLGGTFCHAFKHNILVKAAPNLRL